MGRRSTTMWVSSIHRFVLTSCPAFPTPSSKTFVRTTTWWIRFFKSLFQEASGMESPLLSTRRTANCFCQITERFVVSASSVLFPYLQSHASSVIDLLLSHIHLSSYLNALRYLLDIPTIGLCSRPLPCRLSVLVGRLFFLSFCCSGLFEWPAPILQHKGVPSLHHPASNHLRVSLEFLSHCQSEWVAEVFSLSAKCSLHQVFSRSHHSHPNRIAAANVRAFQ